MIDKDKKRRYIQRMAYLNRLEYWIKCEPPKILFWKWLRWLGEKPVWKE